MIEQGLLRPRKRPARPCALRALPGQRRVAGPRRDLLHLTRAADTLADRHHAKATGSTIRRNLVNIPARIVTSARRTRLHLPEHWPWSPGFLTLWIRTGHQPVPT